MTTNPFGNRTAAVYRVGSLGALQTIPDEGLTDEELYELLTTSGVEWYDAAGKWTDSPILGGR